jgi:4-hydroxybenzoate polyprenyltransferase/phosphoserine phosphatase
MSASGNVPLVVDLDGTLVSSDLLYETFWSALSKSPIRTVAAFVRYFGRPQLLKLKLAELGPFNPDLLPRNKEVLEFCGDASEAGRQIILATGSTHSVAERVSQSSNLFSQVVGSDEETNLTGSNKADKLCELFGEGGFDYIGDSSADIAVWKEARKSYVSRPAPAFLARLNSLGIKAEPLGYRWRMRDLVRGLRIHQWVKNILLFLPIITAHQVTPENIIAVTLAAICFSAAASSIYVVNDLLDLDSDRRHPTKRHRAFAAGKVPIRIGMAASVLLGFFALVLAAAIGSGMFTVIVFYMLLTLTYSLKLKRLKWVDVLTLAVLYTLRVVAGAVAAEVAASIWLIAFILPVFLALACVKRMTEIARTHLTGPVPGRAYSVTDKASLCWTAILSAAFALAILVAYTFSEAASVLYDHPWQLRLLAIPVCGWFYRMISTGRDGRQSYDPIVFALKDRVSIVMMGLSLLCLIVATD